MSLFPIPAKPPPVPALTSQTTDGRDPCSSDLDPVRSC